MRLSRIIKFTVALAVATLAFGTFATPAPALQQDLDSVVKVQLQTNLGTTNTITCRITTEYPHDSHHVAGTVNVRGWITCTSAVSSLSITTDLYYVAAKVASRSASNFGQAFIQTNASTTCVPGYYQGKSRGTVVFPPGYVPQSAVIAHDSPLIFVDCI